MKIENTIKDRLKWLKIESKKQGSPYWLIYKIEELEWVLDCPGTDK